MASHSRLCFFDHSPLEAPDNDATGDLWNPPETETCKFFICLRRWWNGNFTSRFHCFSPESRIRNLLCSEQHRVPAGLIDPFEAVCSVGRVCCLDYMSELRSCSRKQELLIFCEITQELLRRTTCREIFPSLPSLPPPPPYTLSSLRTGSVSNLSDVSI